MGCSNQPPKMGDKTTPCGMKTPQGVQNGQKRAMVVYHPFGGGFIPMTTHAQSMYPTVPCIPSVQTLTPCAS